jgi:hypothetical protein
MKTKNKNDKNEGDFHKFETYQPHLKDVDMPKGGKVTRINAWLRRHWKPVLAAIVIVVIGVGGTLAYLFHQLQFSNVPSSSIVKKKEAEKFYSKLTGAEVSEEESKRPVTGVMIENSPEARPQSGLSEAGIVFESVAEGGITRFLTLYQEGNPAVIGPVRSVRPQFASFVAGFDAGLAHVGGSNIPLQKLRSGQIKDLDQFFNAGTYTRVSNRAAPHNVYTSYEKLLALDKSKGYTNSNFTTWAHKAKPTPSAAPNATTVTVPVSTGVFAVTYTWDKASNTYLRKEGGAPHMDREKGQIAPKVVVALQVPHDVIKDSNNYSYPDIIGTGKGWVFQDGTVTEVTWKKGSDKEQISFTETATSKPIELEQGQVWISIVKPDKSATWQ